MEIQKEKVKVLLLDLGNVVIEVSFAKVLEVWGKHAKVSPDVLKARFVLDTFYEPHERGEILSISIVRLRDASRPLHPTQ